MGETREAVRAEENFREVAATQRSDQPIEDDQVGTLWQNWPVVCSENACYRSIDGITTQSEEDPVKCKTTLIATMIQGGPADARLGLVYAFWGSV